MLQTFKPSFIKAVMVVFFLISVGCTLGLSGCGSSAGGADTEDTDDTDTNTDDGTDTATGTSACNSVTAPDWTHPWPMFHGFENHQGLSTDVGPQNTTSVWTFDASNDAGNPPNSIAISSDGTIYLAGGNKVYALNPTTHTAIWTKSYAAAQGPALSADGGTVYFGYNPTQEEDTAGTIVALDASDGSEQWTYATEGALHFGPTVGPDGTVYQGSWDFKLYALNPEDGSLKWSYLTAGALSYPPSILNCVDTDVGQIIVQGGGDAHAFNQTATDGNIYAFDTDGNLLWTYDTGQARVGSAAIGDDGLIYAPGGPTLYVLDATGALQWTLGDSQTYNFGIISPAIGADGTVYLTNSGGPDASEVYAIDPETEAVKSGWPYTLTAASDNNNGLPAFPAVDSEGTVYFGDVASNSIIAVDADGNLVFSYATGDDMAEAAPALVNGVLYISSDDGNLYVIGP